MSDTLPTIDEVLNQEFELDMHTIHASNFEGNDGGPSYVKIVGKKLQERRAQLTHQAQAGGED